MKIIRYQDAEGRIHYASEQADGTARRIDGDVFTRHVITVILGDNTVGQIRVSGILSAEKLDTLAEMLETEFHVRAERHPEKIVLRSKG